MSEHARSMSAGNNPTSLPTAEVAARQEWLIRLVLIGVAALVILVAMALTPNFMTLDNLRVPFVTDGKFKILSFRSHDEMFKADPGVVPDDEICHKAGITVVKT